MSSTYDYLIVGAGFSGLVAAERLATQAGKRCLVVEKRPHIGGNAYDCKDRNGALLHPYGPHYFRTNSLRIVDYLSQFTEWHHVDYKVLSYTDGRYWSFPVNLKTFEQLIGRESTSEEFERWLEEKREPIESPANSEEVILSQVGPELYEKFFKGYTLKHWRKHPRELDASVCGRIPIRTNRDDRYLAEKFQALPKDGYTALFHRMLEACGDFVDLKTGTDYRELSGSVSWSHMIYTGPIDAYFDHCHGRLPYRSLRFEIEEFTGDELAGRESEAGKPGFWQRGMQVNYPNDHDYTRIVEIKHATGQDVEATNIVREFPAEFEGSAEPFYPVPTPESRKLYESYAELAANVPNVTFTGRLANYRYYNMDQVVGMALNVANKLEGVGTAT